MFRVLWLQTTLNELAALWLDADSAGRQMITTAAHQIDQRLESDPQSEGESREEGERVLFEYPLGITFAIDDPHRLVRVLHVWDIRRRS